MENNLVNVKKVNNITKKNKNNLFHFYLQIFLIIIVFFNYLFIILSICKSNNKIYKKIKSKIKPRVIAISYSNQRYQTQLKLNKKSALEVGKVDIYYSYGPDDIDPDFKQKNKDILSRKRGNGYWLWKPYFINKTLIEKMNEGDYLIYTDACVLYLNSTNKIIEFLEKTNSEMWMKRLSYIEKLYTKRDAFILMGADSNFYTDTNQYAATIQIYKKSKYIEKFVEELLYYSQDKRIITDDKNTLGFKNYKEFRDNRHDQTILSILIKKYGEVNSGKANMNISKIKGQKSLLPSIFCTYRRTPFKNYNDIRNKCMRNKNIII